ncbi:alginate lyase family protein [Paenibacillus methanolicus]|uniref:Heparinase II/III-like protein n=1 Tax=Paenibacillus methanolicus TaxID=582686 RepID=A0A5S5C6P7_9BACL|nr:alginate lyase family protein [Paenibacillus methanolicus]TYP74839.1 heparinase II/III-like protein [Paenibacillus methanolicus]
MAELRERTIWARNLDLDRAELGVVRAALDAGDDAGALTALHAHMANRAAPRLYFRDEELEELIAYVKESDGHELALVMETADEVVRHTFVFRFPWDMERTNEPVTFADGDIDWQHIPAQDPEWTYMLNRHRYWIALGQAYALTRDERYAEALCRQMAHWIARNPVPATLAEPGLAWRTIEAGLRCENWIKAFQYVKRSPHFTPQLLGAMLDSLHEHGEYIASAPCEGWKRISNWGVLENHGLFGLSVFMPEWKLSASWRAMSAERLKSTRLQVMKDGLHWEQSPMYHNEVLHGYMDYLILARNNGISADPEIEETARRMLHADLHIAKPNHHQPLQGDSDDNDLRDLLAAGALLFEDETLRFGGLDRLDFENAWTFGMEGIRAYGRLASRAPSEASKPFAASGNYVMRSDWSEQASYLYFHCGFLGGGHGHADMLHVDVHAYGRDLLTDSGRYNYGDHTEWRRALKRCAAHNTTTVDGIDFTEYVDTWASGRVAQPMGAHWISEPDFDYVEGSHDGYAYLADPVTPLRRIVFIKPGFWLLSDSFACAGEHEFEQHFHFLPGDDVEVESGSLTCGTAASADEAGVRIMPVHPARLSCALRESRISREYNRLEVNTAATYKLAGRGFSSMLQVIYPMPPGSAEAPIVEPVDVMTYAGDRVPDSAAEAVRIVLPAAAADHTVTGEMSVDKGGGAEEHILLICHRKPGRHIDSYVVDGTQVFGEIVWIKRAGGTEQVTVIK